MPISFANTAGNLFNALGKLGLLVSQADSYQNSQLTNLTSLSVGAVPQFASEPDIQALIGSSYVGILDGAGSVGSLAQTVAAAYLNRIVYRDQPRLAQTLEQLDTLNAIVEVVRQMKQQTATVRAHTVAATPTTFSRSDGGTAGNGVLVLSVNRPSDGVALENSYAETMEALVSADSYLDGTTEGNEQIVVQGTGKQTDPFAHNWPLGSGASATVEAVDGDASNSSGNLLKNSGFTNFTNNVPDNWELVTGTRGTDILAETSAIFGSPGKAVRLVGDGSTATQIRQRFDHSSGTSDELEPLTQYGINLWMRRDGTAPANGTLTVDLVDGDGVVIRDANNSQNTFNVDLTALSTAYTPFNAMFRTPHVMPTTYYLRLRLSGTVLTSGRSVYLDKLSLGEATQLYTGGPYLTAHSGATPFRVGDRATVAVTNGRGAGGTLNTFQTLLFRLFPDFEASEILLPSAAAGSETLADSIIG